MGSGTWFAWSRGFPPRVLVQPALNQPAVQVNASRSTGWAGSIAGTTLVYQQARGGSSDIKLWDVVGQTRSNPDAGINTRNWEWQPTISGQWILFGRRTFARNRSRVLLHNTATHQTRTLADVQGRSVVAHPGQVSGTWAVWDRCTPRACSVYRYDIATQQTVKVPNRFPGKFQYYPSVTGTGTVYFAQSGAACGRNVRLIEWASGSGTESVIVQLHAGRDITSVTETMPDQVAGTDVYFDKYMCRAGTSDIFEVIVP